MTTKNCHMLFLTALLLAGLSGPLHAQVFPGGNGLSMAGVERFDIHVQVASWQGIATDPFEFRLQAQTLFESRLAATGVNRQSASRDYLACHIQAAFSQGVVAYTTTLQYWNLRSTGVNTLLWENGTLATTSLADFTAEQVAGECADYFVEEWSKWNPVSVHE